MTSEKLTELKAKAEKFIQGGKWQKAAELYQQIASQDSRNDRVIRRLGDIQLKLGNKDKAKQHYKELAGLYAKNGFWAKAISTNKLVLGIDPLDVQVQEAIVKLYANMGVQPAKPKGAEGAIELDDSPAPVPANAVDPASGQARLDNFTWIDLEEESKPKPAERLVVDIPPAVASEPLLLDEVIELDEPAVQLEDKPLSSEQIRVPLFSEFNPQELTSIIQHLSVRKLPSETTICEAGERGDSIFVIASGSAEVSIKNEAGNKVVVAHLRSGEFFGEFGLLSDGKRHATVTTKTVTELMEITKADFRDIAGKHPGVIEVLQRYYRDRVVDTILRQNELFSTLMKEERQAFMNKFELRKVAKQELLFAEGDEGGDLYFIKSGTFDVSIKRFNDIVVIAQLKPGDFFGEIALVPGQRRTASVRSSSPGELLFLSKANALAIIEKNPLIKEKLERVVVARAEDAIAAYKSHQELKKQLALV